MKDITEFTAEKMSDKEYFLNDYLLFTSLIANVELSEKQLYSMFTNIPEKSYARALCAVTLMGYEKTANAILKDKVNPENVDYYLEEWNDFFNFGGDGKRNTNAPLIIDIHNKLKAIKNE